MHAACLQDVCSKDELRRFVNPQGDVEKKVTMGMETMLRIVNRTERWDAKTLRGHVLQTGYYRIWVLLSVLLGDPVDLVGLHKQESGSYDQPVKALLKDCRTQKRIEELFDCSGAVLADAIKLVEMYYGIDGIILGGGVLRSRLVAQRIYKSIQEHLRWKYYTALKTSKDFKEDGCKGRVGRSSYNTIYADIPDGFLEREEESARGSSRDRLALSCPASPKGEGSCGAFVGMMTACDVRFLDIQWTHRCNSSCRMCINPRDLSPKRLRPDDVRRLLDRLRGSAVVGGVAFGGGEPLCEEPDDLTDVIAYAKRLGFATALTTNGLLWDASFQAAACPHLDILQLPLDACSAGVETRLRGSGGIVEQTPRVIRSVRAEEPGVSLKLGTVVAAPNLEDVAGLPAFLLERDSVPDIWNLYQYRVPRHVGATEEPGLAIADSSFREVVAAVERQCRSLGIGCRLEALAGSTYDENVFLMPDGSFWIGHVRRTDLSLANFTPEGLDVLYVGSKPQQP